MESALILICPPKLLTNFFTGIWVTSLLHVFMWLFRRDKRCLHNTLCSYANIILFLLIRADLSPHLLRLGELCFKSRLYVYVDRLYCTRVGALSRYTLHHQDPMVCSQRWINRSMHSCTEHYIPSLANLPYSEIMKVGLCDIRAVCVFCAPPLPTSECLNQSLLNLVHVPWHLSESEWRTT